MTYMYENFGSFFVGLLFLNALTSDVANCKPDPGRKSAFGGGMAIGGLAGLAIGSAVTHHVMHKPKNTIEVPNGCYKQTIREPDPQDPRKYIETERLVCPNNNPTQVAQPSPPMYPGTYIQPAQTFNPQAPNLQSAAQPPFQQPIQSAQTQPGSNQQNFVGNYSNQPWQTFYPAQPNNTIQPTNSHVIVLSKKYGYYGGKSSADTKVLQTNIFLVFAMSFLLKWFY